MANIQHVEILEKGVEVWNEWRKNFKGRPDLNYADIKIVNLEDVNLSRSQMEGINLKNKRLSRANFRNSYLVSANLEDSDLIAADFTGSNLSFACFEKAKLQLSNFKDAMVTGIKYDRSAKYKGIRVNNCYGSQWFKRFAQDQDFLEEFKEVHKIIYFIWGITSDCGRSILRWTICSIIIAMFFGSIYANYTIPEYLSWLPIPIKETLYKIAPIITIKNNQTLFTPYYFSVVTFSTLGFGDISPQNLSGEIFVTAEVIIGYIMLGGLISIFAQKVARRA